MGPCLVPIPSHPNLFVLNLHLCPGLNALTKNTKNRKLRNLFPTSTKALLKMTKFSDAVNDDSNYINNLQWDICCVAFCAGHLCSVCKIDCRQVGHVELKPNEENWIFRTKSVIFICLFEFDLPPLWCANVSTIFFLTHVLSKVIFTYILNWTLRNGRLFQPYISP